MNSENEHCGGSREEEHGKGDYERDRVTPDRNWAREMCRGEKMIAFSLHGCLFQFLSEWLTALSLGTFTGCSSWW